MGNLPATSDAVVWRGGVLPLFFGLCVIAWILLHLSGCKGVGLAEQLYRSITLFTGGSAWAFEKKCCSLDFPCDPRFPFNLLPFNPWLPFRVLAIVAPLLSAAGLIQLITGNIVPAWHRGRAGLATLVGRRHTAIFALTADSLQFARSLQAVGTSEPPVIFDPRPEQALAATCAQLGIPVFTLLPKARGYLWSTHRSRLFNPFAPGLMRHALHLVSFFDDTDDQLSFARALDAWLRASGVVGRNVWLLMSQRSLRQRLESYLKFSHKTLRLNYFDVHSLAARHLLQKHPLDMWADILGQDQIHLAIYGFGHLGRAIAKEAARFYVTRASIETANPRLRLTILDRDPVAAKDAFLAEEPEIEEIVQIHPVVMNLQTGGLAREQFGQLPDHVTAHVITLNEPDSLVSLALSLRRWLLEPPSTLDEGWVAARRNAPIFIPIPHWEGLGSLVRSGVDWPAGAARTPEAPDGIFGFGNTDDLLSCASVLDQGRSEGARVLHSVYEDHIRAVDRLRPAAVGWHDLPPNLRQSNMLAFDHIQVKARAVGYRIVATTATQAIPYPAFDEDQKRTLSQIEHRRYFAERVADGWRKADTRCDAIRVHPDLQDWDKLSVTERTIDHTLVEAMPACLFAVRKRLVEAQVVGIVGHRLYGNRDNDPAHAGYPTLDEDRVRTSLREVLRRTARLHPGTILLSALATGADTWAVQEAKGLGIPWVVVLPLPFELYRDDFTGDTDADHAPVPGTLSWEETFRTLVAEADYYFEFPLVSGPCSALSRRKDGSMTPGNRERRDRQYALAGKFIVERSNTLLAVWDGETARGSGGTGDLVALRQDLASGQPRSIRAPSAFFPPAKLAPPVIISPDGTLADPACGSNQ